MTPAEVCTWFQRASLADRAAVERACWEAVPAWTAQLRVFEELLDCASWSATGMLIERDAIQAAASAAAELEVICQVWPTPLARLRSAVPI